MYSQQYYAEKKQKIEQRRQVNLQRYINFTFDFTNEAGELNNQMKEIEQQEAESRVMDFNNEQPKKGAEQPAEQPKE